MADAAPPAEPTKPIAQILITLTHDKRVVVQGPITNKPLCLDLLADAIHEIVHHNPQAVPAPLVIPVGAHPSAPVIDMASRRGANGTLRT